MLKVVCPSCGKKATASEEHVGKRAACPQCHAQFKILPAGELTAPAPPPIPTASPGSTCDPSMGSAVRISPESPAGAVDNKLLPGFFSHFRVAPDEDLFFLQKSATPCMGIAGFIKPAYHVAVTSRRIVAIATNKHGTFMDDFPFDNVLAAGTKRGLLADDIKLVVADPVLTERAVSYSFPNCSFNREHLPATIEFVRKQKGGFVKDIEAITISRGPAAVTIHQAADVPPTIPLTKDVPAAFVSGPFDVKSGTSGYISLDAVDLVFAVTPLLFCELKEVFRIPYAAMSSVTVDTAERVGTLRTLGALALGGPLLAGIVGLGMKKKDKFLVIEFKDETGISAAAVFAQTTSSPDMTTAAGKILARRRESLSRPADAAVTSAATEGARSADHPATPSSDNVAALLEKLASLREKGILTDDEFQRKKNELLARL